MPHSLSTSSMVASTKDKKSGSRKCKKPCQPSSSSSCCTEQCIDCCTSQYARLNRFATIIANNQLNVALNSSDWPVAVNLNAVAATIKNRCGAAILPPNITSNVNGTPSLNVGAYANELGCSGAPGDLNTPTSLVSPTGALLPRGDNDMLVAASAYYFVNEFAYGTYEPGCHNDQVYGWYVNISTGELQLFTQTDGVPTNATRACISADLTLSSAQKSQLKVLNKLYKLSKSAIKEVNGIPSQEGNIVEVCDCKGERWLLYINTASTQNGSPLCTCNYQFAVVATKLC
jgi:hypothetical protein